MAQEGETCSRCTRKYMPDCKDQGEGLWVELLPNDVSMMHHPTVTTVTFFDGEAPIALLRDRTDAILQANSWLTGRLRNHAPNGCPGLWVRGTPDMAAHFVEHSSELLQPGISMEETIAALDGQTVKKGTKCLDKDEPLFKVIVVKIAPEKFAVVLSTSHIIGDGATYYAIWSALGDASDAPAPTLDPVRKPEFEGAMKLAVGEVQSQWTASSGVKMSFLRTLLRNKLWGKPLEIHAWYVSQDFMEEQKRLARESGEVPFVSANDVLTSWFFRRNKCDYGMMAINFRDRLLDLNASHAGNYESVVNYWPDEFATAAGVRRALLSKESFKAGREDVPSFRKTYKATLGVATNWSGFAKELVLPNCTQTLHLPIFETLGVFEGMIIFKPTPDTLAFMIADRPGDMSKLDNSAMGEQIF